MDNRFEPLNQNEVVSVSTNTFKLLNLSTTFKIAELLEAIKGCMESDALEAQLFQEGIDCEVLKFSSQSWRKGKVRITVEFCPQELESPLE
ncbi:MAG: KGK domain-containing protein [Calothrix sp. MO_192.B10]|nr:KGK domain-containing protein [Calothrix sp. MO_192.B10]